MNTEIQMPCIAVCFGAAVLLGLQSMLPGAVGALLLGGILLWQERKERARMRADQGNDAKNLLCALQKAETHDEEKRKAIQSVAETIRQLQAAQQSSWQDLMEELQTGQKKEQEQRTQVAQALLDVKTAVEMAGVGMKEAVAELQQTQDASWEKMMEKLQNRQKKGQEQRAQVVQALLDAKVSVETAGTSMKDAMVAMQQAQDASWKGWMEDLQARQETEQEQRAQVAQTLLDLKASVEATGSGMQTMLSDGQKQTAKQWSENLSMLKAIEEDARPMLDVQWFLKNVQADGTDLCSLSDLLHQMKSAQEDLRDDLEDAVTELSRISQAVEDTSDESGAMERMTQRIGVLAQSVKEEHEKSMQMQASMLEAMQHAVEQGKALSKQDTELLQKLLQDEE